MPPPGPTRPREFIATLGLEVLPGESGYYGLISRSEQTVDSAGRSFPAQSAIHYLLTRDRPVNYLHWLASDDTHALLEGGPVEYFLFLPDGRAERIVLGRDLAAGERFVVPVPAGCWKALRLRAGADYALMANVLAPAWTPDRVVIGAGADFVARYRGAAPWATEECLRGLIGPNWRD